MAGLIKNQILKHLSKYVFLLSCVLMFTEGGSLFTRFTIVQRSIFRRDSLAKFDRKLWLYICFQYDFAI